MGKNIKYVIIAIISLPLLYITIGISMLGIEEYIEGNMHNIEVYNLTDGYIDIYINNKIINVEGKTRLLDKVFEKNRIYNYTFKINGDKILEKEIIFPSEECCSYSAGGGGTFSRIIIKNNENNYDIIFSSNDFDQPPSKTLKFKHKRRFVNIFNRDGLNMN